MNKQERQILINEYSQGVDKLLACLEDIPAEMWQFKPEPSEWSVHEILVHLADSETNSALRARRLMVEPGKPIMGYDQDIWANELDYHSQSWEDALEGLKWARKTTYALIEDMPDEIWKNSVVHPEFDGPYSFEMWLEIYAADIPGHIEQIKNNYKIWQKGK